MIRHYLVALLGTLAFLGWLLGPVLTQPWPDPYWWPNAGRVTGTITNGLSIVGAYPFVATTSTSATGTLTLSTICSEGRGR